MRHYGTRVKGVHLLSALTILDHCNSWALLLRKNRTLFQSIFMLGQQNQAGQDSKEKEHTKQSKTQVFFSVSPQFHQFSTFTRIPSHFHHWSTSTFDLFHHGGHQKLRLPGAVSLCACEGEPRKKTMEGVFLCLSWNAKS